MSDSEKARTSGESPRPAESSILPTVKAPPEVKELTRPTLHPAFYVMCDHLLNWLGNKLIIEVRGLR